MTATECVLAGWAEAGQPTHLTARQLLRDPPRLDGLRGRSVHLCENPTVLAEAANRLGSACAPLVCVNSHPAAAATLLLRSLVQTGAELRYHGDFDWPGITIANGVMTRFGARPWRFDTSSYRSAAAGGGRRLRGRPTIAIWDGQLAAEMLRVGMKVEEERVLGELLDDLA
jgi:uncharacterized protein (TIGR02679 family)